MKKSNTKWLLVCVLAALTVHALAAAPATKNIPYVDAQPLLETFRPELLPVELRDQPPRERESTWPGWVARRDAEIRARLVRGDEDSIVNFLLFGVTFTREPRITERDIFTSLSPKADVVQRRIDDLLRGLASPVLDERLAFVRESLVRNDADPATTAGQARARSFLARLVDRNAAEVQRFIRESGEKPAERAFS